MQHILQPILHRATRSIEQIGDPAGQNCRIGQTAKIARGAIGRNEHPSGIKAHQRHRKTIKQRTTIGRRGLFHRQEINLAPFARTHDLSQSRAYGAVNGIDGHHFTMFGGGPLEQTF
jgi:hypothetical protein